MFQGPVPCNIVLCRCHRLCVMARQTLQFSAQSVCIVVLLLVTTPEMPVRYSLRHLHYHLLVGLAGYIGLHSVPILQVLVVWKCCGSATTTKQRTSSWSRWREPLSWLVPARSSRLRPSSPTILENAPSSRPTRTGMEAGLLDWSSSRWSREPSLEPPERATLSAGTRAAASRVGMGASAESFLC